MQVLELSARKTSETGTKEKTAGMPLWLLDVVATVAGRPRSEITFDTRLSDLGFDSLMFVELATAIESAGGTITSPNILTEVVNLRECRE